jgi:hypothetical protein
LIDVQEASVKPPEDATDLVIGELPTVHFQKLPRGSECVTNSGEIGGGGRNGERGNVVRLGCVVAGPVTLVVSLAGQPSNTEGSSEYFCAPSTS